jgi:hypothetical protein
MNGEQGAKRGVPWAKRGASVFNRGWGQSEGSRTFRAPANGGAVQGWGVMPLRRHESCSRTNGGAQKGAGATQRKGVKGAVALPLRDSGANPVRAQTGGRAQKGGGGLACNKGAGAGGDHVPSRAPQRGNKGGPRSCVNGVGRTRPPA